MKEIVYREVDKLVLLEGNPRKISDEQLEKLKDSIDKNPDYFECRPVILSDRTGELVVIAGNQRVRAAISLGLAAVPSILLSGLSEEREKEIIIRDNVSNGEWDEELLAEWDASLLDDWGVDISALNVVEDSQEEHIDRGVAGVVPFTEVLGEEHNYIVLYFDNEVDWLQAQSIFDIKPVMALSTRKDGVFKSKGYDKIGVGRVLNGAKALNKILEK